MRSISATEYSQVSWARRRRAPLLAEVDARRSARGRRAGRCPRSAPRAAGSRATSAGLGRTGRRFAYRPRPLRSPSRPCSGRGASGSVVSHFGPPTAPSSTASAARQASSTSSVSAVPWASIEAPPTRCSVSSNSPSASSSAARRGDDLGPDPVAGQQRRSARASRRPPRRDVEAHVVEAQRARASRSATASTNACAQSPRAGASRCGPRADARQVLARVRAAATRLSSSQHRPASKPARSEPAPRCPRARRSSRCTSMPRVLARSARRRSRPRRSPVSALGDVALAAALRLHRARPAAARRRGAGTGSSWSSDPVERRRWRTPRRPARRAPARRGRRRAARPGRRASRAPCSIIDGEASTPITRPRGSRSTSSAVTRPLPQPASSTVSSPRSGSRSSTSRRPLAPAGRRRGGRRRRPSRGVRRARPRRLTAPSSPGRARRRRRPRRSRSLSARWSVSPMSSSPCSRRCLTSSSISNSDHPAGEVDRLLVDVDPRLAGLRDRPAVAPRRGSPAAARSWCS